MSRVTRWLVWFYVVELFFFVTVHQPADRFWFVVAWIALSLRILWEWPYWKVNNPDAEE